MRTSPAPHRQSFQGGSQAAHVTASIIGGAPRAQSQAAILHRDRDTLHQPPLSLTQPLIRHAPLRTVDQRRPDEGVRPLCLGLRQQGGYTGGNLHHKPSDSKGLRMKPAKSFLAAALLLGAFAGLSPLAGCSKKRAPGVLEDTVVIPPPPSMQGAESRTLPAGR